MRINPLDSILYIYLRLCKLFDGRKRDQDSFDPSSVKNILVISSTAIGDTLLSTPAIKSVRERYPGAKITAHLNVDNMELFKSNPHIDSVVPYYGGYRKFFKTIKEFRKREFDLVLIFHGNEPQATPVAYLSGAPFIFKLPNRNRFRFLLSNRETVLGWDKMVCHGMEQRLKVASLAGCNRSETRMVLPVSEEDRQLAERTLSDLGVGFGDRVVGFQVAASTVSRMWFPERFMELGRRIVCAYDDVKLVITGSPSERSYCEEIASGIGKDTAVSAGKVRLGSLPALIERFSLLVTGDTGIMHVAIAVGTPVVALFAVADGKTSGPYYDLERHMVIQKWKTCDPCLAKRCKYQRCMENIGVDEVFQSVSKMLRKERRMTGFKVGEL